MSGWIKSANGEQIFNLANVICVRVELIETDPFEDKQNCLHVIKAETKYGEYELSSCMSLEEAKKELAYIEQWIATGANGIYQVGA